MKKTIVFLAIITASGLCGCRGGGGSGDSTPQIATSDQIVKIQSGATGRGNAAFGTNPLVVAKGTRVTWDNQDAAPHTVTSSDKSWDSGKLNGGEGVYSHVFNTPGDYNYISTIDGAQSMSGTVRVTD
jgi:plastocyanin